MINLKELYESPIANLSNSLSDLSIALKTSKPHEVQHLYSYHVESATAYLSSRKMALFAYKKAHTIYSRYINNKSEIFEKEVFMHFLSSFIISARTSLDLLLSMTYTLSESQPLPHIHPGFNDKKSKIKTKNIKQIIQSIRQQGWYTELDESRNKIIHRGYHIGSMQRVENDEIVIHLYLEKYNVTVVKTRKMNISESEIPMYIDGFSIAHNSSPKSLEIGSIVKGYCKIIPELEKSIYSELIEEHRDYPSILKNAKKYDFKGLTEFKL